ncbi:MAG: iron ABC transporter permease [Rhizobiales bacterium]|nr:iron ABC transporter permease [Hyphomicrobiales bacterium]
MILRLISWIFAALCLLPIIAVIATAAGSDFSRWGALIDSVLPKYIWNTVQMVFWVALGTGIIGTGTAWLVTNCRFPGRRFFEFALAVPLAFPAYVLAYAYTDLLDHPGYVQTLLRSTFDLGPRDYWFPEIRSLGGAAAMLVFVLYPYVYLLARTAFLQQSANANHAARMLGRGPWAAFFHVNLPMARPAIVAGVTLALMETIADFGTVAHFNVQTFSTGIYRAWFSMGDRGMATQLALCLLGAALLLAVIERTERGAAQRFPAGKKNDAIVPQRLSGARSLGAILFCTLPVLMGFVLPTLMLLLMAIGSEQSLLSTRYLRFTSNSLTLASMAAIATVFGALFIAYCARLSPGLAARTAKLLSGIGYAIPGGVIAVGLLVPFASFDNWLDALARTHLGFSTGLLFTGSIGLLVVAYLVRFMAAALGAVDAGLGNIRPSLDDAARSLGKTEAGMLRHVHLPLIRGSLLTGALIVFVDVMKELPATMIMRPFNFDTLAVQAHRLASDERLDQAAVPSLVIAGLGLIPVIILCRAIANSSQRNRAEPSAGNQAAPSVGNQSSTTLESAVTPSAMS